MLWVLISTTSSQGSSNNYQNISIHGEIKKKYQYFCITKTSLYSFDPVKPHFYTGVYINFLISAQKHRLWVLVRTSNHNLCFEQKYDNYQNFFFLKFLFFDGKILNIFE